MAENWKRKDFNPLIIGYGSDASSLARMRIAKVEQYAINNVYLYY